VLETSSIDCPYCGEPIEIVVDCSVTEQSYVEDCAVCCQPILLHVRVSPDGAPDVTAAPENA
jgi:hypothetical protein